MRTHISSCIGMLGPHWNCLGRVKRCDLGGAGVSLRMGSEISNAHTRCIVALCLLPVSWDISLSSTMPARMPP